MGDLCEQRYVKFSLKPQEIADLLVTVSLEQRRDAPKQIILDLDVTNDPVHGSQAQAFFNAYYDQTCYAPLLIFWGHQLLCARLRPSNVDPAAGALEELQRIIAQIRKRWSEVVIIVRGDSAYGREDIMAWCEAQTNVEYVLAHASNPRLSTFTWGLEQRAKAAYQQHRQQIANTLEPLIGNAKALQTELDAVVPPQVYYQSLTYQTEDSWSCPRRVVCLPHVRCQGCAASLCRHLLLHSICQRRQTPCRLLLSPRRDGKPPMRSINSICSVTAPPLKSLRVINCGCGFPQAAYVLMQALRQHALVHTKLAVARRWHHSPQTPQGCSSNSHYLSAGRHCYL